MTSADDKDSQRPSGELVVAKTDGESRVTLGNHVLVIERHEGGGLLKLIAADGDLPLEISITREGAVLRLGRGLSVSVNGPLKMDMETLSIHAREAIELQSDGPLAIRAAGDILSEGDAQTIRARRGDVDVTANDDVLLHGERIKMNC